MRAKCARRAMATATSRAAGTKSFLAIGCCSRMRFPLLAFFLFLAACSNYTSRSPESEQEQDNQYSIDDMLVVKGGNLVLGSNDSTFRATERPAMNVVLDYDYYLDVHEVTCGDYRALTTGGKLKDFGTCENDSLPLTNVTFYDAVLYANARGVELGYDTAYTYSKAIFDSENPYLQ